MDPVQLHDVEGTSVAGYRACTCGELVLEHTWHLMGGLCTDCFAQGKTRIIRVTEVMSQGRKINLPTPGSRSQRGRRGANRGKGLNHAIRKQAKLAAQRRLADIYPEMFAMVYAEERLKRGLAPVPLRTYEPVACRGVETYDFDPVYAALAEQETADGPS